MSDSESSIENSLLSITLDEEIPKPELQQKRRGRPRKYETTQDRIDAISKKQRAEKREKTKLKHKLIKEGHQNQFQLAEIIQTQAFETEYIDEILKNIFEHKIN